VPAVGFVPAEAPARSFSLVWRGATDDAPGDAALWALEAATFFDCVDTFAVCVDEAVTVWAPTLALSGTVKLTVSDPERSTRNVGIPVLRPSNRIWPRALGANPWPVTWMTDPTGPCGGLSVIVPTALADMNGMASTGSRNATSQAAFGRLDLEGRGGTSWDAGATRIERGVDL
jgi:hypothetical protein